MRVHFIAVGGSAMHNLAIALHKKGYKVTGSDDEIVEPSKGRLLKYGLLPSQIGWNPSCIDSSIDAIILGMHARIDNPELLKAQELGLKIYSYPDYIYEQTKDKTRVVVAGSHGKTTITSIILHVLKHNNVKCDYLVGAQLEGFETMVNLEHESKVAIIEGDEYLASPIDRRPKFHIYKPHIAILSGIAWDHINVFPTFENYVDQFRQFLNMFEPNGTIVYCKEDEWVQKVVTENKSGLEKLPYAVPENFIENGVSFLKTSFGNIPLKVFGNHNLMNLNGARIVCNKIGISDADFYNAISTFKGAAKRLELVKKNDQTAIYKDFAHSPSKLKATIMATKQQYPNRKLIACMELHTFSSLNENFLKEYSGAMDDCDVAVVYFNPHTIAHKKLKPITIEQVQQSFMNNAIKVFTSSNDVREFIKKNKFDNTNLLLMSSGNFDGIDFAKFADELIN
ncbi:MAG: peptidoglycan synthetase [Bacteroidetes bacterium]|nr:peptidoglycan synthetase [Bacteroidota bacterium]